MPGAAHKLFIKFLLKLRHIIPGQAAEIDRLVKELTEAGKFSGWARQLLTDLTDALPKKENDDAGS